MEMEIDTVEMDTAGSISNKKVKLIEDVMNADFEKSTSVAGSSGSINSDTVNAVSSYHESEEEYDSDYDDYDDYMFENYDDDDDDAHYLSMQAEFDNVDLPPGVEATVPWLKGPSPSTSVPSAVGTSTSSDAASLSAEAGTSNGVIIPDVAMNNIQDIAASEIKVDKADKVAQVMQIYEQFKRFDVVDDFSDHHYICGGLKGQQPTKDWAKKVQGEWKILEEDLPDTIFVRVCEKRMDLLRAVIVGPAGTPYHDGLFTFDIVFPLNYPDIPPVVYYYAGGLRLNPNLYECGKVCLSLLGTWSGKGSEKWMPNQSTMLQVLVSIQALILNTNPFFNEPGHESSYRGAEGDNRSTKYNEEVFILSLKTMMYTLRRPPKHFEALVVGHFRTRAHAILSACKAYMEGAQVGSAANMSDQNDVNSGPSEFKLAVRRMVNGLVTNFCEYAAVDCQQFRVAT